MSRRPRRDRYARHPEPRREPLQGSFLLREDCALLRTEWLELELPLPDPEQEPCWPWETRGRWIDLISITPGFGLWCQSWHSWRSLHTKKPTSWFEVRELKRWREVWYEGFQRAEGPWQEGYPAEVFFAAHAYLADPWIRVDQAALAYGASIVLTSLCLQELWHQGYRKAKEPDPPPRPKREPEPPRLIWI